jgi:GLPGLI family protein
MKKYLLILLLTLITDGAVAQNGAGASSDTISGQAIYLSRITLTKTIVSTDTLQFNRRKSLFQWQIHKKQHEVTKKNKASGRRTKLNISPHDNIGEYNLYNAAKGSLYSRKYLFDQVYFVKEKKPDIQWNITDSTKKIGNYICTMATAHFRGRNYTAWFTPKIPVHYGPWKLIGLPGLILKAHDQKKNIYFSAQKVVFKNVGSIGAPARNGSEKVVDLSGYKHAQENMKKRMMEIAHKLARKYAPKDKKVKINVPEPKFMEIFGKKEH